MSVKGGYLIIDLHGTALTSGSEASIAGLWALITNPYNKPTLISGLVVSDVAYPDFYAPFVPNDTTYTSTVVIGSTTISIEIDTDDNITVTSTEAESGD